MTTRCTCCGAEMERCPMCLIGKHDVRTGNGCGCVFCLGSNYQAMAAEKHVNRLNERIESLMKTHEARIAELGNE